MTQGLNKLLMCLAGLALLWSPNFSAYAADREESVAEYQVKAAFLFNFIKFVDWPDEETANLKDPIVITIVGDASFGDAFNAIENRQIKGRNVVVKWFKSFKELKKADVKDKVELTQRIEQLRKSQLLFICSSEKDDFREIIETLKGSNVLTVGEMDNFLEAGGSINFLIEDKKVCFEINNVAAENAKLKIRSKLLRLAKRIVGRNIADIETGKTAE